MLTDSHQRRIRKLRLSLTDACNLRCTYCMPIDQTFMSQHHFLQNSELNTILHELCTLGIEELRITGGEPLLRRNFDEIIIALSQLPFKRIALTTNGILLHRHLDVLKDNKILDLNISLDSLNENSFRAMTHGVQHQKIIRNIVLARAHDFNIKLNVVAQRGFNDHEILDFMNFAAHHNIEIRFLELMRIGTATDTQTQKYISAHEIKKIIDCQYHSERIISSYDSTSINYRTECGIRFGFIASESTPFCSTCSRWRLSADGVLRACLFKEDGISLRNKSTTQRQKIYSQLLSMKPLLRQKEVLHQMNILGG